MATYATAADVLARWIGADRPTDEEMVGQWVDDAELFLRREYADFDAYVDAGGDERAHAVTLVMTRMVMRALKNPDGRTTTSRTAGPFTESWTAASGTARAGLYLTVADRALIAGGGRGQAGTIDTDPANRPATIGW